MRRLRPAAAALLWGACALSGSWARAGDLVDVDFAVGARVEASPLVASWSAELGPWLSAQPAAAWADSPVAALRALDAADARSHAALEPLARALAEEGATPASFAAASSSKRAQWARAAAARAAQAARAELSARAGRCASPELSPSESLRAATALLKDAARLDAYLDAPTRRAVRSAYRAVLERQLDDSSRRELATPAGEQTVAAETAPAGSRTPRAASGRPARNPAPLLRFDPARRKTPPSPQPPALERKPGQDPALVARGMMLGLSREEAGRFAESAAAAAARRDDLYTRFPKALAAAQEEARRAAPDGFDSVYFVEARAQLAGAREPWGFTFFSLSTRHALAGRRIEVGFEKGAARARPAVVADLPSGAKPFSLDSYLLQRGAQFSPAEARARAGALLPEGDIGLTAALRPVEEPQTGEVDLWYVFERAGRELARVNGRTGQVAQAPAPGAPPAAARPFWRRWLEAWRGRPR